MFHCPIPVQWKRSPGKSGSHFDPNCDLFAPNERMEIITSTTCWFAMLTFLVALTAVVGPLWVFKLYFVPYWVYTSHSQPLPSFFLCTRSYHNMFTVVTLKFLVHTFLPQHIPHCDTWKIGCRSHRVLVNGILSCMCLCRSMLCGWMQWHTCIIMDMKRRSLGTVGR